MIEMPLGWLSPQGEFYECEYYEHTALAEEIVINNKLPYNSHHHFSEDQFLLNTGWVKFGLALLGHKEYWIHWERKMTPAQRYYAKTYFEDENLKFPMNATSVGMWKYEDEFFEDFKK